MERRGDMINPSEGEPTSTRPQSPKRTIDHATGYHLSERGQEKERITQPESSKDHPPKEELEEIEQEIKSAENKWEENHFEYRKVENELIDLPDMPKVFVEKTENYEGASSEFIDRYDMIWFIMEQSENYGRTSREYEYKSEKYNDAKSKYEKALCEFKKTTLGQNILPHGEDLSAEELAQRLEPALNEAWIRVSNAHINDQFAVINHMINRLQKEIKNLEESISNQNKKIKLLSKEIDNNYNKIEMAKKRSIELKNEAYNKEKEYFNKSKNDFSKKNQNLTDETNDLSQALSAWEKASKNAQKEREALQRASEECTEKELHLEDAKKEKEFLEEKYHHTRSCLRDIQHQCIKREIKKLEFIKKLSDLRAARHQESYYHTEEKCNFINPRIFQLKLEQKKVQKEYDSLLEDMKAQVDPQHKTLDDLQKELQNALSIEIAIKEDIQIEQEKIIEKKEEIASFKNKLNKIVKSDQVSQNTRDKVIQPAELKKKSERAKKNGSDDAKYTEQLEYQVKQLEDEKKYLEVENLKYSKNKSLQLKNIENLYNSMEYLFTSKVNLKIQKENIESEISYLINNKNDSENAKGEKNTLESADRKIKIHENTLKYINNMIKINEKDLKSNETHVEFIIYLRNWYRFKSYTLGESLQFIKDRLEMIKYEIKESNNGSQRGKNLNPVLKNEGLFMQDNTRNKKDVSNSNGNSDLSFFGHRSTVIKKYDKNYNMEEIDKDIKYLKDNIEVFQTIEHDIKELKNANRTDQQEIAQEEFSHKMLLKEIEQLRGECELYNSWQVSSQESEAGPSVNPGLKDSDKSALEPSSQAIKKIPNLDNDTYLQDLMLITKNRKDISKLIQDSESEIKTIKDKITEVTQSNEKLDKIIVNQKPDNEAQTLRLLESLIDRIKENNEKLHDNRAKLLQKLEEKQSNMLAYLKVVKDICKERSRLITTYQPDLEGYHTTKSNLQGKIDAALAEIRSRLEADLRNLQNSSNEKKSKLKSVQSELAALEKGIQQEETKRQELQDQFKQINQKKRNLEAEIEQLKKNLDQQIEQSEYTKAKHEKTQALSEKINTVLEKAIEKKSELESYLAKKQEEQIEKAKTELLEAKTEFENDPTKILEFARALVEYYKTLQKLGEEREKAKEALPEL